MVLVNVNGKQKKVLQTGCVKKPVGKATVRQLERCVGESNLKFKKSRVRSVLFLPYIECFAVSEFFCSQPQIVLRALSHPLYEVFVTTVSPGSLLIHNLVDKMFQVVVDNDWFRWV